MLDREVAHDRIVGERFVPGRRIRAVVALVADHDRPGCHVAQPAVLRRKQRADAGDRVKSQTRLEDAHDVPDHRTDEIDREPAVADDANPEQTLAGRAAFPQPFEENEISEKQHEEAEEKEAEQYPLAQLRRLRRNLHDSATARGPRREQAKCDQRRDQNSDLNRQVDEDREKTAP